MQKINNNTFRNMILKNMILWNKHSLLQVSSIAWYMSLLKDLINLKMKEVLLKLLDDKLTS